MDTPLNRQRVAALEKVLRAPHDAEIGDALGTLRSLGFATTSGEIPEPARPGSNIKDFFDQTKGYLAPIALLPRELWPQYRSKGTIGNAVWLCRCEACGHLTTVLSRELNPTHRTQSCGCSRRASNRSRRVALG
jgi:hypothetical protein